MAKIAAEEFARATEGLFKAAQNPNSDDVVRQIMDALQVEFLKLPAELQGSFEAAALAGVVQAGLQIDIADEGMLAESNEAARAWAHDRAAELVGMSWDADGKLVPNPDARWMITDTTRDDIQRIVADAFAAEKAPLEEVQAAIQSAGAFTDYRAELIARTEIGRAQVQGTLQLWGDSGMVQTYDWLVSEDENLCEECEALAEAGPYVLGEGPVPIDDSHPNCQCILSAAVIEEGEGD